MNNSNSLNVLNGYVIQKVSASSSLYSSITNQIPYDDTIPQNTEGTEISSISFTPKSQNNEIIIDFECLISSLSPTNIIFAIFVDSIANALYSTSLASPTPSDTHSVYFTYVLPSYSGTKVFKIRAGPSTATTIYLNGITSGRLFGGVSDWEFNIREIKK